MQLLEQQFERLKKASGASSDTAFADFLGISQGSISGAKKKHQIPHSWFFQVADKTNVSSDWLFFGRGPMYPGEAQQPAANAPEPPVTPVETASCARCAKLEAKVDALEEERRELSAERRKLSELNIKLFNENTELRVVNGDLKAKCAVLEERQKTCCPDPLPYLKKKPGGEGSPNCAQVCA